MSCFNFRELPSSQPKIPWVWLNRTQALNSFNEFQWIHSCISRFPILGVFSISLNINYCCTFVRMFLSTLSPIFNITFFRHKMAYHYTLYILLKPKFVENFQNLSKLLQIAILYGSSISFYDAKFLLYLCD